MRIKLFSMLTLVTSALASVPVLSHHGWSGQNTEQSQITGKVQTPVSLGGPHATFLILAEGKEWTITLAPPARTKAAGLAATSLKVGDTVTVLGNRHSDPNRFEMKTVRVTLGDRNFDIYPERIKR